MVERPVKDVFYEEAMAHLPALTRYARFTLRNADGADDLVQETFLEAWKSFHRYEPGTNCKAWLFRIFKNLLSKKRRKDFRHAPPISLDAVENPDALMPDDHATEKAEDALRSEEVLVALDKLPDEYKDVLLLLMEGLSYKEIAEALAIPAGTVMSRIHRARETLRKSLKFSEFGPMV